MNYMTIEPEPGPAQFVPDPEALARFVPEAPGPAQFVPDSQAPARFVPEAPGPAQFVPDPEAPGPVVPVSVTSYNGHTIVASNDGFWTVDQYSVFPFDPVAHLSELWAWAQSGSSDAASQYNTLAALLGAPALLIQPSLPVSTPTITPIIVSPPAINIVPAATTITPPVATVAPQTVLGVPVEQPVTPTTRINWLPILLIAGAAFFLMKD